VLLGGGGGPTQGPTPATAAARCGPVRFLSASETLRSSSLYTYIQAYLQLLASDPRFPSSVCIEIGLVRPVLCESMEVYEPFGCFGDD
jgi:hypothetical protein